MSTLTIPGLEAAYDALAEAIDRTPEAQRELMLVKLALLLANELGDAARLAELTDVARRDL
jgi:Protein of unknown function (DUF2783)